MKKNHFLLALVILLLISCNKSNETPTDNNTVITNNNTNTPTNVYVFNNELVWSDEFDEDGSISLDKWTPETIPPVEGGWYNGEFQFYTDKLYNVRIEDGILKITAKKENFNGKYCYLLLSKKESNLENCSKYNLLYQNIFKRL